MTYTVIMESDSWEDFRDMIDWGKKNCSNFSHVMTDDGYDHPQGKQTYRFTFGDEGDALMFKLRWL